MSERRQRPQTKGSSHQNGKLGLVHAVPLVQQSKGPCQWGPPEGRHQYHSLSIQRGPCPVCIPARDSVSSAAPWGKIYRNTRPHRWAPPSIPSPPHLTVGQNGEAWGSLQPRTTHVYLLEPKPQALPPVCRLSQGSPPSQRGSAPRYICPEHLVLWTSQ